MDFKEYLVKRNKNTKEKIFTVLLYLAALVIACVCMLIIPPFGGVNLLLAVGAFYGAYKLSARFNREYEYIVTDDCVDIDAIYNKTSRKRLISFFVKDVQVIASVNDVNQKHLLNGSFANVIDATTNRKDAKVYFAVTEKNGRTLVKFEPPYAALEILKKHAPLKVFISE